MAGGGGAPQRNFNKEWPSIKNFENKEFGQLDKYFRTEPLLSGSREAALGGLADIPKLQGPLADALKYLAPIIQSGGQLNPAESRDVTQATRAEFTARGNAGGNQAIGAALLNRSSARRGRFGEALNQVLGTTAGYQDITGRAIQPALATQQTAVGTFAQVVDPVLQYLSNLFAGNQQAQVASQQASQGKSSGLIGGGISAIGSIAGAAL